MINGSFVDETGGFGTLLVIGCEVQHRDSTVGVSLSPGRLFRADGEICRCSVEFAAGDPVHAVDGRRSGRGSAALQAPQNDPAADGNGRVERDRGCELHPLLDQSRQDGLRHGPVLLEAVETLHQTHHDHSAATGVLRLLAVEMDTVGEEGGGCGRPAERVPRIVSGQSAPGFAVFRRLGLLSGNLLMNC